MKNWQNLLFSLPVKVDDKMYSNLSARLLMQEVIKSLSINTFVTWGRYRFNNYIKH